MKQLYVIGDIKFGELKGVDQFGNHYYEDKDLPFGQHRWIEYADIHNPDAAMIQPEWHGWMHHVFDETPAEVDHRFAKIETTTLSDSTGAYDTHVGLFNKELQTDHDQHTLSQYRQRGYNIGSLKAKGGEKDRYYLQPGHPLSPIADKGGRFKDRKELMHSEEDELFDPRPNAKKD